MQVTSAEFADRPVPVLIGNGELVTRLNRHGYHSPPDSGDTLDLPTQNLVLAGRRHGGPEWQLVDFGRVTRDLRYPSRGDDTETVSEQTLDMEKGEVRSKTITGPVMESTRTLITLHRNLFFVETSLTNRSSYPLSVSFTVRHGIADPVVRPGDDLRFGTHDNLGAIRFRHDGPGETQVTRSGAFATHSWEIEPGDTVTVRTWLTFSDRFRYQAPVGVDELEEALRLHREEWRRFWSVSRVETGHEAVDRFRAISLYTLRCQSTPWSIPPGVTKPYWDGGTFHDEMYPFLGLISAGHAALARNVPYHRLATLPRAVERARGRGALYPWSATEFGEERDPHGHWYTERFHLGQIAACVWWQWLYGEDMLELEDLYPVLREIARYFELQMIEEEPDGKVRTKPCTDFDESVGEVSGGPMTMGAAIFTLERAAEATRRLGTDRERGRRWERLAHRLRDTVCVNREEKRYEIPDGKALHYSIVGLIAPFFVDVGSEYARNSVRLMHALAKSEFGWKPGFHEGFEGSTWMWTAGHLGMCHGVLGDGERLWETLTEGPKSASQFGSPNEHLNREGRPMVPWFTTGCGAWLTALHWMFLRVDDDGVHLLSAVPQALRRFRFDGLAAKGGVTVACEVEEGVITRLVMRSPKPQPMAFQAPKRHIAEEAPESLGDFDDFGDRWRFRVSLLPGDNILME